MMKKNITAFMMAWGNFLSIPCPKKIWDNNLKKDMLAQLPIIGFIAGILEYGLCYLMHRLSLPISVAAFMLTLLAFGISGFMHADGFMDVCDAVLSRRDLAERQRILKDSRVGAFAVISMILMALGTFAAFFGIYEKEMEALAISHTVPAKLTTVIIPLTLIMIPVISRATAGSCVLGMKPLAISQYAEQKNHDNSSKYIHALAIKAIVIFIVVLAITVVLSARISGESIRIYVFRLVVPTVSTLLATRLFAEIAGRNLGGMSGDIAGFSICMGELIGLIVMAIVLYRPI